MKRALAFFLALLVLCFVLPAAGEPAAEDADKALRILKANGEDAYVIGEIIESEDKITII